MKTIKCIECGKEIKVKSLFIYGDFHCDCGGIMKSKIHYPSTIFFYIVFFPINLLWCSWISGFYSDLNNPVMFMLDTAKLVSTGFLILSLNLYACELYFSYCFHDDGYYEMIKNNNERLLIKSIEHTSWYNSKDG